VIAGGMMTVFWFIITCVFVVVIVYLAGRVREAHEIIRGLMARNKALLRELAMMGSHTEGGEG